VLRHRASGGHAPVAPSAFAERPNRPRDTGRAVAHRVPLGGNRITVERLRNRGARVKNDAGLSSSGSAPGIAFAAQRRERLARQGQGRHPDEHQDCCQLVQPATILKWFREGARPPGRRAKAAGQARRGLDALRRGRLAPHRLAFRRRRRARRFIRYLHPLQGKYVRH
jgi:hypothetical protein